MNKYEAMCSKGWCLADGSGIFCPADHSVQLFSRPYIYDCIEAIVARREKESKNG